MFIRRSDTENEDRIQNDISKNTNIVKDKKRRASLATLGAVQWTVSGVAMAAGAPAVNLVEVGILCTTKYTMYYIVMYSQGKRIWRVYNQFSYLNIRCLQEEPKLDGGPVLHLRTEEGHVRERLETRSIATLIVVQ